MADEDNKMLGEKKKDKKTCMQWLIRKVALTEEGATPPNWKYLGLTFAALVGIQQSTQKLLIQISPFTMSHCVLLRDLKSDKEIKINIDIYLQIYFSQYCQALFYIV